MKRNHVEPLRPYYEGQLTRAMRPDDMTKIKLPPDIIEGMQAIALSIFTDCSNAGISFRECLSAIYMSGLHHGQEIAR